MKQGQWEPTDPRAQAEFDALAAKVGVLDAVAMTVIVPPGVDMGGVSEGVVVPSRFTAGEWEGLPEFGSDDQEGGPTI